MEGKYYRHFKGNIYRVLHIAKHSEALEDIVVYQAMYGERGVWVRPSDASRQYQKRKPKSYIFASPLKKGQHLAEILVR